MKLDELKVLNLTGIDKKERRKIEESKDRPAIKRRRKE